MKSKNLVKYELEIPEKLLPYLKKSGKRLEEYMLMEMLYPFIIEDVLSYSMVAEILGISKKRLTEHYMEARMSYFDMTEMHLGQDIHALRNLSRESLVVSDLAPILVLIKIGRLDVLRTLFKTIYIPESLSFFSSDYFLWTGYMEDIMDATDLFVVQGRPMYMIRTLNNGLSYNEIEAIDVAEFMKADFLIMDEEVSRKYAERVNVPTISTISLLIMAYCEGYLTKEEVRKSIYLLRDFGQDMSDSYYDYIEEVLNSKSEDGSVFCKPFLEIAE